MKIIIGINHPKQVYIFKNIISILQTRGIICKILVNEKDLTSILLKRFNYSFKIIGKNQKYIFGKILQIIPLTIRTLIISIRFKPDIFLGQAIPHLAYTSAILRKPYIIFEDTESASLLHSIVIPFAKNIITPSCFKKKMGRKHITIDAYSELCYLHKKYFIPDISILNILGVHRNEKYIILRFVSWNASHDIGQKGMDLEIKKKAIKQFSKYAKVFISSEESLTKDLEKYKINIPPEKIHDALYFATMFFGESATMASESALLGTPAIYIDNIGRGYTDEEENKYHLVFNYKKTKSDQNKSIQKGIELLQTQNIKEEFKKRRNKMLKDKIDVTNYLVWFIKEYPISAKVMNENPKYYKKFI